MKNKEKEKLRARAFYRAHRELVLERQRLWRLKKKGIGVARGLKKR